MSKKSKHSTIENTRTGIAPDTLRNAFLENLKFSLGRTLELASKEQRYEALALTVRDRLMEHWVLQLEAQNHPDVQQVAYLSAEFLVGPHLGNNLLNLDLLESAREGLEALGIPIDDLIRKEEEPGLGNGGLGRLAACYLDSMATLGYPATGYGIRYEFGIFDQAIHNGWQQETTDKWLHYGNVWELARPEFSQAVKLGGRTEGYTDERGRYRVRWLPERVVVGIPYDTPILGYHVKNCSLLRLWSAEAARSFDFEGFNRGDYYGAVRDKVASETISKILYPNDEQLNGKQLRLEQQYFFVACSIKDMIRLCKRRGVALDRFHEMYRIQLNDTHPSIAVAELMRQLIDKHDFDWDAAWVVTQKSLSYTNHTLLPEALEKWPRPLFGQVLPRHLEIITEINRRFLETAQQQGIQDPEVLKRLSIFDEEGEGRVRMGHLAVIGSHAVNGVAKLHSALVKTQLFPEFHQLYPERFHNVTNGVTPRRFVALSNPGLKALIDQTLDKPWLSKMERLKGLEKKAKDPDFQEAWQKVKHENKVRLARIIEFKAGVKVDPNSLFDVQVKRIHEYKRQHLNALHIIALYHRLLNQASFEMAPRTFIFGGKAAPGYAMAKLIIKLIHAIAEKVNQDPVASRWLKIAFLPDYNVKNAQNIYPAADLSEQISTAGMEASGTGNMKLSMNGALTIGTLDGANIEIREAVGPEHFFLFGHTAEEVLNMRRNGYDPRAIVHQDAELKAVLDLLISGHFSPDEPGRFKPLTDQLLGSDYFQVLADFRSYADCQGQVNQCYLSKSRWTEKSILNVARMGEFSSDRSIREYAEKIWKIDPMPL